MSQVHNEWSVLSWHLFNPSNTPFYFVALHNWHCWNYANCQSIFRIVFANLSAGPRLCYPYPLFSGSLSNLCKIAWLCTLHVPLSCIFQSQCHCHWQKNHPIDTHNDAGVFFLSTRCALRPLLTRLHFRWDCQTKYIDLCREWHMYKAKTCHFWWFVVTVVVNCQKLTMWDNLNPFPHTYIRRLASGV